VVNFFRHRLKIRDDNRLSRLFYEALAGHHIEDLPRPYAATASDIVAKRSVTITSGPIIDAIEASIAIPVVARPVAHQGRYLLDGGFWDAAPVDAATELGADVIVAVELGQPYTLPERLREPATWLARRFERAQLHRTLAGVPFTIHAAVTEHQPGRAAHVVLRPAMGRLANRYSACRSAWMPGSRRLEKRCPRSARCWRVKRHAASQGSTSRAWSPIPAWPDRGTRKLPLLTGDYSVPGSCCFDDQNSSYA